ncbi:MAG: phosphoadenylyl-sulfate reductase [Bryobacteraceae bacterium]
MRVAAALDTISEALEGRSSSCITCSFQAEGMVLLQLVRELTPDIPVLFVDTGYHFADVYRYRDEMTAKYRLNLVNVRPSQTVAEQESQFGLLYQSQPDKCCKLRKVGPLFAALENYDVWFTGLRRAQSPTRANLQVFDRFPLPSGKTLLKVSPLADWSDEEVWSFAREHEIPLLPLYESGYTSIGCEPCTARPPDAANARSGRWGGRKLECGIHIAAAPLAPLFP